MSASTFWLLVGAGAMAVGVFLMCFLPQAGICKSGLAAFFVAIGYCVAVVAYCERL